MFQGTIPPPLQAITRDIVTSWKVDDLYVACSGAFTIERTMADTGMRLHGCDVLLFSSAIGSHFAGQPLEFELSEKAREQFPWVKLDPDDATQRLAVVSLTSAMAQTVDRPGHAYYGRMKDGYEHQWDRLLDATMAKIAKAAESFRLASFTPEDASTWIDSVPADAAVASYPPFWEAGYTTQFARHASLFEWDAPTFDELDDDLLAALFEKITSRRHWVIGRHEPMPEYEPWLRGKTMTSAGGIPVYVYASDGPTRLVMPRLTPAPLLVPRYQPGDPIGPDSVLSIQEITREQYVQLRSVYLDRRIHPGGGYVLPFAVLLDGRLIGVFGHSLDSTLGNWQGHLPAPTVYLLSDFPVVSRHRRLAKLVLYAAMSREAALAVEGHANRRYRSVVTTAFTDRPVSMKYRGMLRLLKRQDNGDGSTEHRYRLSYGAVLGEWDLQEGYRRWWQTQGSEK